MSVRIAWRSTGGVSIIDRLRSPARLRCKVRGIGVGKALAQGLDPRTGLLNLACQGDIAREQRVRHRGQRQERRLERRLLRRRLAKLLGP